MFVEFGLRDRSPNHLITFVGRVWKRDPENAPTRYECVNYDT